MLLRFVLAVGDKQRAGEVPVQPAPAEVSVSPESRVVPGSSDKEQFCPWMVFVQRALNPMVGFNLLLCAMC